MSFISIDLEHGGGEEGGGGGVLLLHAPLQLVNVQVADTLGGVVCEAHKCTALAVSCFVAWPPLRSWAEQTLYVCTPRAVRHLAAVVIVLLQHVPVQVIAVAVLPVHDLGQFICVN